jgi:hypothetical protein
VIAGAVAASVLLAVSETSLDGAIGGLRDRLAGMAEQRRRLRRQRAWADHYAYLSRAREAREEYDQTREHHRRLADQYEALTGHRRPRSEEPPEGPVGQGVRRPRPNEGPWPVQGGTDIPGIISLIFGCVAVACVLLGFLTCGLTDFVAFPLALIGFVLGCCARGELRVAGLTLNLLALIPAVLWFMAVVTCRG